MKQMQIRGLFVGNEAKHAHKSHKVCVVGCGAVGMAAVYSLLSRQVVGEIVITDIDREKLQGEVLDMSDTGAFLPSNIKAAGDDYEGTENSDIIVIAAGVRQKEGESRRAPLARNVEIFKSIIPPLVKKSPECLILVVSNPVDTMTYVAWKLSGLPRTSVFGLGTFLDSSRFQVSLADKLDVDPQAIQGCVIGEQGDASFPVWSNTSVAGVNISDAITELKDDPSIWYKLHQDVQNSTYKVIKSKGYTNWAVGMAVCKIVEFVLRDVKCVIPLSVLADGAHGIKDDVALSLPCVLGQDGIRHIVEQPLTDSERNKLQKCVKELKDLQSGIRLGEVRTS